MRMIMNYFNTLSLRKKLDQLVTCSLISRSEFDGVEKLIGKKVVIIGCGAQGLNQGLNMRDSGLNVSYTLREAAISEKRQSYINASQNGFTVGVY
jgi:ketol-acid reductoisomerase